MLTSSVFDLARLQSGVISRRQLLACDLSNSGVDRARRNGWLIRLLPGTFLVSPSPDTFRARCFALQVWLDGAGVLTGRTAGRLHGLAAMGGRPIQCLVPASRIPAVPDWVEIHRSRWYFDDDADTVHPSGLRVTNPQRTLFALAAVTLTQRRFDHIADDAWNLRLVTPAGMATYLERHRCRGKDGVALPRRRMGRAVPAP